MGGGSICGGFSDGWEVGGEHIFGWWGGGGGGGLCPVGSIYTNLVGFIQETSESIAIVGFFLTKKILPEVFTHIMMYTNL